MWPDLEHGSWADWITGIGTIAAVGVAIWQVERERRTRRAESHREDARKVTDWREDKLKALRQSKNRRGRQLRASLTTPTMQFTT